MGGGRVGGGTKGSIYSLCRILHSALLVVYIVEYKNIDWKQPTEHSVPFDLTCVTRYALKITCMQYLCVTVAMPGNP